MFMQVVPLQVEIEPGETFLTLIRKIAGEFSEVARYRGYPIRNTLNEKIYDVFLNFHNAASPSFLDAQCELNWIHPGAGNEVFTLQVHDFDQTGSFDLDFDFDCEVFSPERQETAVEHFFQVMDSFLTNFHQPLREVGLLTPAEREQILYGFNRTDFAFPTDKVYPELLELQAARTPDRIAAMYEDQSLTYAELNAGANRLARHLRGLGVGPEDVIVLLARRGLDLLTAILGVMKAGAAYLPLDPFDPSKRHGQLLAQSRSRFALASAEFLPVLGEAIDDLETASRVNLWPIETQGYARYESGNLTPNANPNNLAYVIFTSGSTGTPKGAMIVQQGMINHLYAKVSDLRLDAGDVIAQTASQCFDISVWQFLAALMVGGQICILSDEVTHDPRRLLQEVERRGVTVLEVVPSLLHEVLSEAGVDEAGRAGRSGLRWLLVTGEAAPPEVCRRWLSRYPRVPMMNAYGPTECSDDVTHYVMDREIPADMWNVPIGIPVANTRLFILDEYIEPAPVGVRGELYVGGDGVGRGYLGRADRTAERFVPDPFCSRYGERLYRTGDVARYLPGGQVEFLGRLDGQVKVRGYRIESGEIEHALSRHAGIRQAVVVAREDEPGEKRIVAYYVVAGGEIGVGELREYLRVRLPDYMVPVLLVQLNALPLNANGKVDRQALPRPDLSTLRQGRGETPPRNPWELQLTHIWQDILGLERVGVTDNFFDLGGHSLLAVRMLAQIRRRTGRELPLSALIEAGTIERLATLLMEKSIGPLSPLVPIKPEGNFPPLFCIHPGSGNVLCYLPLAEYLDPEQPVFGIQDPAVFNMGDEKELEDFYLPIEEMAARYIRVIQSVQAEGPYLLCGWSFGGFVVYEIAQQLTRLGHRVGLLAVLDTGPVYKTFGQADDAELLAILAGESGLEISISDLRKLTLAEQLELVSRRLKQTAGAPSDIPTSWIMRSINIFKTRIRVGLNYQIKPYPNTITLICAAEQGPIDRTDRVADPTLGWSQFSPRPVDVMRVPGNHATMGQEPHVKVLSETLQAVIWRATENAATLARGKKSESRS
jgi:amino acid adenylation domain-containing protein